VTGLNRNSWMFFIAFNSVLTKHGCEVRQQSSEHKCRPIRKTIDQDSNSKGKECATEGAPDSSTKRSLPYHVASACSLSTARSFERRHTRGGTGSVRARRWPDGSEVAGAGSEEGSTAWARVKGGTENALMRLFKKSYMFRHGFMRAAPVREM
jgi:hypothetical protein